MRWHLRMICSSSSVIPRGTLASGDEIVCLDAQTLTVRLKFDPARFQGCYGLTAGQDELYAADKGEDAQSVLFRRRAPPQHHWAVQGPERIVHFGGRLYVSEVEANETNEDGRRIFVLTPSGEVLQKYVLPEGCRIIQIYLFGEQLMCIHKKCGSRGQRFAMPPPEGALNVQGKMSKKRRVLCWVGARCFIA